MSSGFHGSRGFLTFGCILWFCWVVRGDRSTTSSTTRLNRLENRIPQNHPPLSAAIPNLQRLRRRRVKDDLQFSFSEEYPPKLRQSDTAIRRVSRGGAAAISKDSSDRRRLPVRSIVFSTILVAALYQTRETWLPLLNKERLQAKTLSILRRLRGSEDTPMWVVLLQYTGGMAIWEFLGLATIPVETAAAMVFGWPGGLASAAGKLLGAAGAFGIAHRGRGRLAQKLGTRNELLGLLLNSNNTPDPHQRWQFWKRQQQQLELNPWWTCFCLKFSCVPELVKNCGAAWVGIPWPIFLLVTMGHGWMFTALWTWTGVDAALRLENANIPSDRLLQVFLGGAFLIGVLGSPLLMAWWIQDLRSKQQKQKA